MQPKQSTPPNTTDDTSSHSQEMQRVFELQRASRRRLTQTTATDRIARLKRLRAMIFDYQQEIRDALFSELKKSPVEADLTDIATVISEVQFAIRHLPTWLKPKRERTPWPFFGTRAETRYQPKGVSLIISSWNFPFQLTLNPLVSAIAAGCPAIIKPSEIAPHAAELLETMLSRTFDESEVAVFRGDATVAQKLLSFRFDHIFFVGSPRVGRLVMKAASEHPTPVTLELGGKSPVIVDRSADVDAAAAALVRGKFLNAGQTCVAPDYVYVHDDIHDALVDSLRARIHAAYGATLDERQRSPDYCRIINDGHVERLRSLYEDTLEEGATAAVGRGPGTSDRYVDPTVLTDVSPEAAIMQEEIFGPLLPVLRYRDLKATVEKINWRPTPLALYIFSSSKTNVEYIIEHAPAGGTTVNDTLLQYVHPDVPVGGARYSGFGRYRGWYGFREFSSERAVVYQRLNPSPLGAIMGAPYTRVKEAIVQRFLRML